MEIKLIGKGGFASEVVAYLKKQRKGYKITCLTSDEYYVGGIDNICIGDPKLREKVFNEINQHLPYKTFNFSNVYGKNKIGEGTIICPGVIITTNVECGILCQFNLQTSIGHDCKINNFVTTAPKVSISGNVEIGNRVYIGTGATIIEKVKICSDVIIGAGAVVVKDITEPGTYVGVPAKRINL